MEEGKKKVLQDQLTVIPFSLITSIIIISCYLSSRYLTALLFCLIVGAFNFFIVKSKQRKTEFYTAQILCFLFINSAFRLLFGYFFNLQFHLYVISLCAYHFGEYFGVLLYHYDKLSFSSYLIDQSSQWVIATTSSFIELIIENYLFHNIKFSKIIIALGVICMIVGHIFRMGAIYTGKKNFTHIVAERKKNEHELVKEGIYSISRHPSYFGFYLWSIGTQIMCVNPICVIGFTIVLYLFFKDRIINEEYYLITFFGQAYVDYRKEVPILIPCKNIII